MGNVRISLEKRKRRKNLRSEDVLNGRRTSIFNWGGERAPFGGGVTQGGSGWWRQAFQRASKVPG